MEEITDIGPALEMVLTEVVSTDETFVTTRAYENICMMETSLAEDYSFRLPDADDLMESLVYPETSFGGAMGIVSYNRHLAHMYVMVVSMMISEGTKSTSLIGFLRLLVAGGLSNLLTVKREGGDVYLIGTPEFERIHQVRLHARIPYPQ
ncbi:hypothetical protein EJ078_10810 [Mesorhizobium sp. M1A.F.Ca.IN.022.06.1.1]|uniref:hypothetical protein n=1 Tax=Mesorhizobium sp. M1A.F.Ca.IN.022.06.1.1 TaxID=2493680 RepID=UPI000F7555B6|nr:hypothetical protein [Mesorhizobium sp. M1A.F.Ca.IN.022.06.1.1]AZO59670.1 hypothetical protein EJ078_10810 [Mesorhizobium sp. M1A.F.Ca.IN.022.06.1.1]